MEYALLLILHVLGASIFVGGYLIAAFGVLPTAKKAGNVEIILNYLNNIKMLTHIGLLIQFLTGFRLSMTYLPISEWFKFSSPASINIFMKLLLYVLVVVWMIVGRKRGALDAQTTDMGKISSHVMVMTLLIFGLFLFGMNFRTGLL